jgi:hypothetical protein
VTRFIGFNRANKGAKKMNPIGLIYIGVGMFSFLGGIFNWDWFFNAWKARMVVKTFTRKGARIFHCILGIGFVVVGALCTFGIIL